MLLTAIGLRAKGVPRPQCYLPPSCFFMLAEAV